MRAILVALLCALSLPAAGIHLHGRIVDENGAPVNDAQITISNDAGANVGQTRTDPTGMFQLDLPDAGDYVIHVERTGYYELPNDRIHVEGPQEITLALNSVREVFQSVNVKEEPSPVDIAQTHNEERLSGTEVNDIPITTSHNLRAALRLTPGVVLDPTGGLHFNGAAENQVLYLLNGFDITDPITGEFHTKLAVEGIRSLDFDSARYSPEYGKGSAGVLAIRTGNGTDAFHYTATNFVPAVNIQQGIRLGNWYPRFGVTGPILRGRAWFSDNFQSEYDQGLVTGLPSGQNTRTSWAGSNVLHTQFNLTPANIVFADFLVNIANQGRTGLGPLDPVSTTTDLRSREYFVSIKDEIYFGHGALLDFGYAHNDFIDRQVPQGSALYVIAPTGRSGNYFVDSTQTAARDQGIVNAFLPAFHLLGSHQIKAGVDADRIHYHGSFQRTGYELLGLSGEPLSQTAFAGSGVFEVPDTQAAAYVVDDWRVSKRLQLELGVREDWDQRIHAFAVSPRFSFSWAPFASGHTRIAGGWAITRDQVNLGIIGRAYDQSALTTHYNPDGTTAGPPALSSFVLGPGPFLYPRASNWSVAVDHQIHEHLFASVKYLRRRSTNEFTYENVLAPDAPPSEAPLPSGVLDGVYQLTNLRRDDYDAVTVSVHQTFSGQFEWMGSFTHSRAISNAVLDINTADPVQIVQDLSPVPWDAPNRALGWAYLPLPWKNWAIAALADARTGFPFSIQSVSGQIQGAVDSHRYPFNFDLNISLERMITLRGYRFALRGGINNATNQRNPTAVNNVIGGVNYLTFYGEEGRHFVVRIRFFGHAVK